MKSKLITYGIVILVLLQVSLFILSDYIIKEEEIIQTNIEVKYQNKLDISDVIKEINSLDGFRVSEIISENEKYKISGEIRGTKEEIEKMLQGINYFGIISYTINIDQDDINLKLTLEERTNNDCI